MEVIHRTRTDFDGKVHVLFVRDFEKVNLDNGVESSSDGIHRIHRTDAILMEKVHVLFVGDFEKVNLCWMRG